MQLYRDYHWLCHSLTVSCAVVKKSGLAKCWCWRELRQEATRMSKYFHFDILIDTLTSDTIYRSNLKKRFSVYIANRYAALIMTTYKWMKVKHNFRNNPLPARWPDPQDVEKLGESLSPLLDMVPTIPTKIIWSYGEWQPSYQKRSSCLPSWPIWKWKVYLWFVNFYKKQKQNVGKYGSSNRMEMWHVQTHHRNWPCTPPECWLVDDVTSFLDIIWHVVIQGPYVRIPDETFESARAGADISCRQHADSGATG